MTISSLPPTTRSLHGERPILSGARRPSPPSAATLSMPPDAAVHVAGAKRSEDPAHPHPLHIGEVPALDERYTLPASRARTVIIRAGSSSKPGVIAYESFTAALGRAVVAAGGNTVTGGGTKGPMGGAFNAAAESAKVDGAGQNLMVVKEPVWGDEDFVRARAVGKAASEEQRFDLFQRLGATLVNCAGGPASLLEAVKAANSVVYPNPSLPPFDDILIVGDFYEGLQHQVEALVAAGTMKPEQAAKLRFVPASDEVIGAITAKVRQAVAARDTA